MDSIRIRYLIEYPEYIPQLAQWLFEEWDSILGEKAPAARIKNTTNIESVRLVHRWLVWDSFRVVLIAVGFIASL
jgi:hypothetical protein